MNTYYESAEGIEISKARAMRECERHGADAAEMLAELGDCETYDAQEILAWLGY